MGYDNVKLWFAKNEHNEIVTIDDLKDSNTYLCPVCGSDLIPKATESKRIAPHFAHVDKSKCSNESMMHFWFKHKFLEVGDQFKVVTDKEHTFVCKEVLVEQEHNVGDKIYRPDVTIITECGKTIYFEMNYGNKKEVKDYIDIWLELKNIVVEIDIKQLMNKTTLPSFKALFYDGKCFNTKRNDTYYNTIGKYKENLHKENISEDITERVRKLDWFWEDLIKYKNGKTDIKNIVDIVDSIDKDGKEILFTILNKKSCSTVYEDYLSFRKLHYNKLFNEKVKIYENQFPKETKILLEIDCNIRRMTIYTKENDEFELVGLLTSVLNDFEDINRDIEYVRGVLLRKKGEIK